MAVLREAVGGGYSEGLGWACYRSLAMLSASAEAMELEWLDRSPGGRQQTCGLGSSEKQVAIRRK